MFFCNDTATTEIYTLSLHDALPILVVDATQGVQAQTISNLYMAIEHDLERSEEHTSELQSRQYLVCRLLLEKKNPAPTSLQHTSLAEHRFTKCVPICLRRTRVVINK